MRSVEMLIKPKCCLYSLSCYMHLRIPLASDHTCWSRHTTRYTPLTAINNTLKKTALSLILSLFSLLADDTASAASTARRLQQNHHLLHTRLLCRIKRRTTSARPFVPYVRLGPLLEQVLDHVHLALLG